MKTRFDINIVTDRMYQRREHVWVKLINVIMTTKPKTNNCKIKYKKDLLIVVLFNSYHSQCYKK